ncbi:MAG TPA: ABC transporter permease [Trebonia sp.]|jgi:peptide/nickel transport system permease protein
MRNLGRQIGFQAVKLVLVLWLVSILVFLALRLTPGDPAVLLLGPQAGRADAAQVLASLRQQMGLDRPWVVQYGLWIWPILRGNFGASALNGERVLPMIAGAAPPTLWLIALSLLVSVPLAIVLGMWAAQRRNGVVDGAVRTTTTLAVTVPGIWLGLLLIILFSVELRALPSGGFTSPLTDFGGFIRTMVLPVATLSVYLTGVLTRFVYSEASDVMRQDYMRTAAAMGIPAWRRIFHYATKNAALPLITIIGVQASALVGGAVLVEAVFNLGGLGQLLLSSVQNRDYQVVQGAVLLITVFVLVVGFLADIAYRLVDPRIAR